MDYEEKYKETYDKAIGYKVLARKEAYEAKAKGYVLGLGGPFISKEEYEASILPFWEKYGRKPKKIWFDLFGSRDRLIDPEYIPADMYFNEILPYINNMQFYIAVKDKCMFDHYLPDVRQPETVCKCMSGFYYDAEMNMISRAEAVKLCLGHDGRIILKPSIESSNSRNLHCADTSVCREKDIEELFDRLGADFIVQHRIEQHTELARLNPDTVNVIRLHTFLTEEGVHISQAAVRVGAPGEQATEQGSGGWACEIEKDNTLNNKATGMKASHYENEDGEHCMDYGMHWRDIPEPFRADSGYEIPSMDRVRDIARTAHMKLPHFRWIGWDFTVDAGGEPVLVEYNLAPGINVQIVTGKPMFGEMTEEILDDYFIHRRIGKNQLGMLI
jgi:hypothetical protein